MQVVVGITNPNLVITWTLKSYEYYIDATNYGLQLQKTVVYQPTDDTGTEQSRNQIRMLPFVPKIYSSAYTPFRIAFKLSSDSPSLVYPFHQIILSKF